jgi:CheY-like chemotaxis protein
MIKRVICVDDDAICLMIEEMVIKQTNIVNEIHLVNNAIDALSLLNTFHLLDGKLALQESPTLLFLDLNMPVMDGFAFLDALDAKNSSVSEQLKIVILSSSIDSKDISRSKEYKTVINFISKPLTTDAVEQLQKSLRLHSPLIYGT